MPTTLADLEQRKRADKRAVLQQQLDDERASAAGRDRLERIGELINSRPNKVMGNFVRVFNPESPMAEKLDKAPGTLASPIAEPVLGSGTNSFGAYLENAATNELGQAAGGRIVGAVKGAGDMAADMASPLNLTLAGAAGMGGLPARAASALFAAQGVEGTKQAAEQLGTASAIGTPQEQGRAAVGLAGNVLMAAGGTAGALHGEPLPARPAVKVEPEVKPAEPKVFSEFGGEQAAEAPALQLEAVEAPQPAEGLKLEPVQTSEPEAPAKPSSRVARRMERDADRPTDLLDVLESELGGKISLGSARALQEDFQPTGALRDHFHREGRYGVDEARQAVEAATGRDFESDDAFLSALRDAAEARRAAGERARSEKSLMDAEFKRQQAFDRANRPGKGREAIRPEDLMPGDTLRIGGEPVRVKEFGFDPDTAEVTHVVLEGDKFGTRRVESDGAIHADKESLRRTAAPIEWPGGEEGTRLAGSMVTIEEASGGKPVKGSNALWLKSVVDELKQRFPGAAKVHVVQSVSELKAAHRAHVERAMQEGKVVRGFYDKNSGEAWLIADHIGDETTARLDWLHEAIGHDGMWKLLSDGEKQKLYDAIKAKRGDELAKLAKLYGLDLKTEEGRGAALGEFVARASKTLLEKDGLWQRIKDALLGLLARAGVPYSALPSRAIDARMRALARKAAGRATATPWDAGGSKAGEGIQFSLAPDSSGEASAEGPDGQEPIRQRAEKILGSDEASDALKAGVLPSAGYEVRPFATIEAEAQQIIASRGQAGALGAFHDLRNGLPADTRAALGAELNRALAVQEREARAKGDTAAADAAARQQVELWTTTGLRQSTELAQGLNAQKLYDDMTPAAKLKHAKQLIDDAGAAQWQKSEGHAKNILNELRAGEADAVQAIRNDKPTNEAARQAVDAAIVNSTETHRGVVMEVLPELAQSPVIVNTLRQQLHGKFDALVRRQAGTTADVRARLEAMMRDTMDRIVTIAQGHYQLMNMAGTGADYGRTLAEKITARTGLAKPIALEIAKKFDQEFALLVTKAKKGLSKRLAAQRARQEAGVIGGETAPVDAVIRQQLRARNLKLGAALDAAAAGVRKEIGDEIVRTSGLEGPEAEQLRDIINKRFEELAAKEKRRRLEQLAKAPGAPPAKLRGMFDELARLKDLGAFDDAKFFELIKKKLKIPVLDEALAKEIVRRANDIEKLPAGFLRDRENARLLTWISKQGGVRLRDLPMAIFYSNILSGMTTPAKVVFENLNLLAGNSLTMLVTRPQDLGAVAKAYVTGGKRGSLQSAEILRSGIMTGIKEKGPGPLGILEQDPFKLGRADAFVNLWKYVAREISAVHVATFAPAWEVKQTMIARELARKEGLSGDALRRRTAELMANTDAQIEAARAQATAEGITGKLDYARRVQEILLEKREAAMPGSTAIARDFALRTTYLNEPYGALGYIATGVRSIVEGMVKRFPVIGRGVKSQIPFTTVVSNIVNEKLNWTPVGLWRAADSLRTGELYGREMMAPGERTELVTKALAGTAALTALGVLANAYLHDEDPKFAIYGAGPVSPNARKLWQSAGNFPHSIKIGQRRYSYMNTPLGVGLAMIGNYMDHLRFGKGDQEDAAARLAFVGKTTVDVVIQQGMLDGVRRIFEVIGNENSNEGGDRLLKLALRTGSSFVVPNLVNQVDRAFDPTVYDATGVKAALLAQIPIARRLNKPAITALGDVVQSGPFNSWGGPLSQDDLLRTLVAKQAWVPVPSKNQVVGDRRRGPDHYRAIEPDEYYDWVAESGERIRHRLEAVLPRIDRMEPEIAQAYVRKIAEQEHERWLKRLRK